MRFATVAAMRRIEQLEHLRGVSYYDMMTEAGTAAAQLLCDRMPMAGCSVTVLCGKGNNGGDGLVVATHLFAAGAVVTVVLVRGEITTDPAQQALAALPQGIAVVRLENSLSPKLLDVDLLIDAVYGIGFAGESTAADTALYRQCGDSRALQVSLDIPSGVQGDSGQYTSHFPAMLTIVMGQPKPCHLVSWSREACGELLLAETRLTGTGEESGLLLKSLTPQMCALPERKPWGHKGDNGRLAVVCGSRRFTGAAVLACTAALRSGVGYVHLLSTQAVCDRVAVACPEAIFTPLPESPEGGIDGGCAELLVTLANKCDAVLVGCGLGDTTHTAKIVRTLLGGCDKPLLLDADGINALAGDITLLAAANCPVASTPHPGEFLRLAGAHINAVCGDYTLAAAQVSAETGATLLLKGAITQIFRGQQQPVFSFMGNDGLAKGGSGDLLAGIIASLMAQTKSVDQAVLCGAWLHGRVAELADAEMNRRFMLPGDLAEYLCDALEELER